MTDHERLMWLGVFAAIWLVSVLIALRAAGFDPCVWAWIEGVV